MPYCLEGQCELAALLRAIYELRAERDKLRDALKEISKLGDVCADEAGTIARAALTVA